MGEPIKTRPADPASGAILEMRRAEPDLIDRIANALPEEVRAEYYRELRHCRSLPENDEMLRLLRAMQFLVLLIEQAPSRVAEERERLDKMLGTALDNITRLGTTNEAYHYTLQRKLAELPTDIANGINPAAVAGEIREILRQEFMRSTIPKTADVLAQTSEQLKNVCIEFSKASDTLSNLHKGAAEDARKAVAALKSEVAQALETATRFTTQMAEKSEKVHKWAFLMVASGSVIMGLAFGMMFERWLYPLPVPVIQQAPAVVQPAPQAEPQTPPAPKSPKTHDAATPGSAKPPSSN